MAVLSAYGPPTDKHPETRLAYKALAGGLPAW